MDGRAPAAEHPEIALMQASERNWVLRAARQTARGLRSMPPGVLLALLSASALVPVLGTVVGAGAVAMAAGGVVSSLGGGMLSGILTEVVQHGGDDAASSQSGLEQEIAAKIEQVLAAGDANAQALRAEISVLLGRIDAGGTALRAAMEAGDEQLRRDIVAAFEALGAQYTELGFLMNGVAQAVAEIQQGIDEQGASLRAIQDQNERQRTDIRLFSDQVTRAVSRLTATMAAGGDGSGDGRGPRWTGGCPYRGLLPFGENDADIFYGRERLTAELTAKVAEQTTRGGLLVVTGASGAGKSSLLQAGLMRKLAEGQQVPGSQDWPCVLMTPTADPLTELQAGWRRSAARRSPRSGTSWPAGRTRLTSPYGRRHCPPPLGEACPHSATSTRGWSSSWISSSNCSRSTQGRTARRPSRH